MYRPGTENAAADALSRISAAISTSNITHLQSLHERLCHPGATRLQHFVWSQNLPFSTEEIRRITSACKICAELKPQFHRPPSVPLIKATQPFEWLSIDFKGPLESATSNKYLLTIVDEYSRFPFAYPCKDMSATTVIRCLSNLFSIFGTAAYIHSDRGTQFMSNELHEYLSSRGIASSRTSPYTPRANGQCERYNGIIWKVVQLGLRTHGLPNPRWELVLPDALHSIQSLLCMATNCTPHECLFAFDRRSATGQSIPLWMEPGAMVLLRRHIHSKVDPLVDSVELLHVNPQYAHVRFESGKEDTISSRDLAPAGRVLDDPVEDPEPPAATFNPEITCDSNATPSPAPASTTIEPASTATESQEL